MNSNKTNQIIKSLDVNKKKIIFNARLTDGTNEYLARDDYSSSPIDFYWENDKGVVVYIVRYRFEQKN